MSLGITPEGVSAVYEALRWHAPFRRMKLPGTDAVTFHVTRHRAHNGAYNRTCRTDEHDLYVSEALIGSWNTLSWVVAHEMVHLHQARAKTETANTQHNAEFRRISRRVCSAFGWDYKQFV